MKFRFAQLLLWLGACLALTNAIQVYHQSDRSSDAVSRQDDRTVAITARDYDPIGDGIYERDIVIYDRGYDLQRRAYEEALRKRQFDAALKVVKGIIKVVNLIKGQIQKDKDKRSKWTYEFIQQLYNSSPHFNWILCHTDHDAKWIGDKGKDWGHMHQELPVSFHKTVGYDIYWGKTGTFVRKGDGGYLNWAYMGNVTSTSHDGKTLVWGKPY